MPNAGLPRRRARRTWPQRFLLSGGVLVVTACLLAAAGVWYAKHRLDNVETIALGSVLTQQGDSPSKQSDAFPTTVENYLIAPRAYGDRLKLSNVAVVLAFVVGAEVAGVIGALIALPVAAIYPSIEKIWLRETLPEDTVREHKAIEHRKAG